MNIRIYKGESNHLAGMALHILEGGDGGGNAPSLTLPLPVLHTLLVTPGGFLLLVKVCSTANRKPDLARAMFSIRLDVIWFFQPGCRVFCNSSHDVTSC